MTGVGDALTSYDVTNSLGVADDEIAAALEAGRSDLGPSARELGAAEIRAGAARRAGRRTRGPDLALVRDLTIPVEPELPARLYRSSLDPQPLLVYVHGGGWTMCDLESHDRVCRRIAEGAGVAVLALDYRLAPEHQWPASLDDVVAALRWARAESAELSGGTAIGVAGDSAGGNLAALSCLRLRDLGEPQPDLQVLIYPNTDLTFSHRSVAAKATGWFLTADDAEWFAEQWVPDPAQRADPRVSPLSETDLAGLAPAVVVTCEHDPLLDEGNGYAVGLAAAGVPVDHRQEPGQIHGFVSLDSTSPASAQALDRIIADIARHLH